VKIEAWTIPTFKQQLQEFLGVVNYTSKFLLYIATVTVLLVVLIRRVEVVWTALHDAAMTTIKKLIAEACIMKPVDYKSGVPIWLIIVALSALNNILRDTESMIITDHQPLTYLKGVKELSRRRIRWGNSMSTAPSQKCL